MDGVDGTETGINNNSDIPGVAVFANANPGMLVGNNAGVDALRNGTYISIKDEPNQEEDENGENYLSRDKQVPTLEKDVENNEPSAHSATIEHVIANIDTTQHNMTLAVTLAMMEQFLPTAEVLMFSGPLKCQ